jgi:hypothetical protein
LGHAAVVNQCGFAEFFFDDAVQTIKGFNVLAERI